MKRTLKSMAALAALAWLIPSTTVSAQDAAMTAALEELERKEERGASSFDDPHIPAVAILRQASGPRAPAELDAFADRLAEMMADTSLPEHVRWNADLALTGAAALDSRL